MNMKWILIKCISAGTTQICGSAGALLKSSKEPWQGSALYEHVLATHVWCVGTRQRHAYLQQVVASRKVSVCRQTKTFSTFTAIMDIFCTGRHYPYLKGGVAELCAGFHGCSSERLFPSQVNTKPQAQIVCVLPMGTGMLSAATFSFQAWRVMRWSLNAIWGRAHASDAFRLLCEEIGSGLRDRMASPGRHRTILRNPQLHWNICSIMNWLFVAIGIVTR